MNERAWPPKNKKYYTKMLDTLVDYNHRNNLPLSNEKLQQVVSKLIAEMEEEERDAKCNANDLTMDTFYNYSPITTNTQGEIANMKDKRQISLGVLAETIKGLMDLQFNQQSTILNIAIQRKMTQKAIQTAIQR